MKPQQILVISLISIVLIALLIIGVYFAVQQSVFKPESKFFVQYTSQPNCGNSICSWAGSDKAYSPIVTIDTGKNIFRFESQVSSIVQKRVCKSIDNKILPSGRSDQSSYWYSTCSNSNVVPTYIDTNNCQHWSLDQQTCVECNYGKDKCDVCTDGSGGWQIAGFWTGPYGSCSYANSYWKAKTNTLTHINDYGGIEIKSSDASGSTYWGCYEEIKVYKNNVLIDVISSENVSKVMTYYDDGVICSGKCAETKSGIYVNPQTGYFVDTSKTCSAYQNEYNLLFSNDSYIINISTPKTNYMQGEDILLNVKVTNNLNAVSSGKLEIDYEVPTIIGTATKTDTKDVTINQGENNFQYTIPTNEPVSTLRVKPKLTVYYPTNKMNGLNYDFTGSGFTSLSSQDKIVLGTIEEDWREIMIIPQQIYYLSSGPCKIGYTLNKDKTYCLSDEINGLSCVIIGCPSGYTPEYQCTSSGFCSQTIYTASKCTSDSQCPTDAKCDIGTGYCINTLIYNIVVQCSQSSDCLIPCEGKTSSCENSRCVYSGECSIKSCNYDSDCISPCNGISMSCTNNKCVSSGECIPQPPKQTFYWIYLLIGFIVLIIAIIIFIIYIKKK